MPLSDVLFQDTAQSNLQRAFKSGRMPHAYLFTGPPGVGKEMLATGLAQTLLCANAGLQRKEDEPAGLFGSPLEAESVPDRIDACGKCTDCELFIAGNHPDFHRLHRMLGKLHPDADVRRRKATLISVDVIRHFLINPIGVRPGRGRAKIFIIAEAERLSDEAQNAMLKTLEEPPGHSYLILLATSADTLLATTRSRCQQLALGTLPDAYVLEQLSACASLPSSSAQFLSALAQGSLGLALRYAELGMHEHLDTILAAVNTAPEEPMAASKTLQELTKEIAAKLKKSTDDEDGDTNNARDAQSLIFAMIGTVLRDTLRSSVGAAPIAVSKAPIHHSPGTGTTGIRNAIRAAGLAEYHVTRNANTGLIFDELAIALSRRAATV